MKKVLPFVLLFIATRSFTQTSIPPAVDEIVVTASALPETVETTPAAVTVISKEEIDRRGARDVADVLREVPGLTVSRSGSPGRATSLFTRGGNSTHTLVLWNGIEINNPYFSGYDWGRFSTAGVQQVEVVRGPYSALYGSEAVSGVVNVLTNPSDGGIRAELASGQNGLRNGQLSLSSVRSSNAVSATVERREDDGFDANDDFDQTSVNGVWRWASSNGFSLSAAGRYTSYDLGIPRNLDAAGTALVPSPRRRMDGSERQISLPIQQTLGAFTWELTLAESRREDGFHDPDDPFGFTGSVTDSETRRARLVGRLASSHGTLVAGAEYERAEVDDVNTFGTNLSGKVRNERSLFIEERFSRAIGSASRLELSAGVRRDDFGDFGKRTSPRLAAAWIAGNGKLRAAYGAAFRAPSIGELYFPFSGNLDLRSERSSSFEIGYDRFFSRGERLSVTAFSGRHRDLIVFDNASFAFANIGTAKTRGVEIGVEGNVRNAVYFAASYTFLDSEQDGSGDPLLRRPRHSGSVHLGYRTGSLDANLGVVHMGARDDVLPVAPFSRTAVDANTTIDATLRLHLDRFTPFVKVENATDERYEEVLGYPSPGRRAIVGVRYVR
ncbi:MAG TPA: TonB-dependent receptor [Thermoanaerobaculia bacterium]|nr:TonB-dependent receptor [Thermoanaerobaculia bacterium]